MLVFIGKIYQTLKTLFHHIFKHLEDRQKTATRRFFKLSSRCLEMCSSTVFRVMNYGRAVFSESDTISIFFDWKLRKSVGCVSEIVVSNWTTWRIFRFVFVLDNRSVCLAIFKQGRDIYQTRRKVLHPNTEKKVENTKRRGVFLTEIRGVWIAHETQLIETKTKE